MSDFSKSLNAAEQLKPSGPPMPSRPGNIALTTSVAQSKQATKQVAPIEDNLYFPVAARIGVLGCGQAGGRIAQAFWALGYRRVGVLNTTVNDFDGLDAEMPKLSLDVGGASKDMKLAKQVLASRDADVRDLLFRAWGSGPLDCILICAGLGGGTGGGMSSSLVALARKHMAQTTGEDTRVGAIVSLPQPGEGQLTCRNAIQAFSELMAAKVSPLIVIDNARVKNIYSSSMADLYPKANSVVAELFNVFNDYAANRKGLVTFDQSEFFQLLDSGILVMGSAYIDPNKVSSPADVRSVIRDELANNVLSACDLRRGKKGVCVFVTSHEVQQTFSDDYLMSGFEQLDQLLGSGYPEKPATVLHRGIYTGDDDSGIQCYTLIGDLEPPRETLSKLARVGSVTAANAASNIASFLGVD